MARTPTEIPSEIKEQMRRDYRRGLSLKEVSAVYGIGYNRTYAIVRGCYKKSRGRKKGEADFLYENAAQDYINGLSIQKIAKKYGFSVSWVYKALYQKGVKIYEHSGALDKHINIVEDIQKGEMTQSEIARKYNVTRQRIFNIKKVMEENKDVTQSE